MTLKTYGHQLNAQPHSRHDAAHARTGTTTAALVLAATALLAYGFVTATWHRHNFMPHPLITTYSKELLDVDCLRQNSKWIGAGGNAYVLILTQQCGSAKAGFTLKSFLAEQDRDDAVDVLATLPRHIKALAGLANPEGEHNKFEGKCVHAKGDCCSDWMVKKKSKPTEYSDCYFMAMRSAGTRTMEECFESDKLGKFAVRAMTKRAVEVLMKLHAAGWSHCDYQLKNIMLDNACAASSLSVVDLDGMAEGNMNRNMRDFANLFGVCDMGAMPLHMFEGMGANGKAEAKRIHNSVQRLMDDSNLCVEMQRRHTNESVATMARQILAVIGAK